MPINPVKKNIKPGLAVPSQLDGELRIFLENVKERLEAADGDRGQPKERFTTLEELERTGLITLFVKGGRAEVNIDPDAVSEILTNPIALQNPSAVAGLAVAINAVFNEAGVFTPTMTITWNPSANAFVFQYELGWKEETEDDWNSVTISSDSQRFVLEPVIPGITYDFRIRAINALGIKGEWTYLLSIASSTEVLEPEGPGVFETFGEYANSTGFLNKWSFVNGAFSTLFFGGGGKTGGKVMQTTGTGSPAFQWDKPGSRNIAYDADQLYRLTIQMRKRLSQTSGTDLTYVGLTGVAEDGVTLVNRAGADSVSSQHYIAISDEDLVATATGWETRTVYVKGLAAAGSNQSSSGTLFRNPFSPAQMHEDTRFVRPIVYYSTGGTGPQNAIYEFDFLEFVPIQDPAIEALGGSLLVDPFFGVSPFADSIWAEEHADGDQAASSTTAPAPTIIVAGGDVSGNALEINFDFTTDESAVEDGIPWFEVSPGEVFFFKARVRPVTAVPTQPRFGLRLRHADDMTWQEDAISNFNGQLGALNTWVDVQGTIDLVGLTAPTAERFVARPIFVVGNSAANGSLEVDFVSIERAPATFTGQQKPGLVPDPNAGYLGTRVLQEDGTWVSPNVFSGFVDSSATGEKVPSGWSAVRNGAGQYTVTHNLALGSVDDLRVVVTLIDVSMAGQVFNRTGNSFDVSCVGTTHTFLDRDFYFIAHLDP